MLLQQVNTQRYNVNLHNTWVNYTQIRINPALITRNSRSLGSCELVFIGDTSYFISLNDKNFLSFNDIKYDVTF